MARPRSSRTTLGLRPALRGLALAAGTVCVLAPPAVQAQTNLALNRPATGSMPCNINEGPAKAVNGSVSGGNTDKWCTLQPVKFLQVDLQSSVGVARFVVRHAGAGGETTSFNTRDFNIQVSGDGSSFDTVVTVTGNTQNVTTHEITPRNTRFVRLNVTTPTQTSNSAARIYEVEVFGPGGGLPPPRETIQEHWFEHDLLVRRVAFDDHAAIYFDDDTPRVHAAWILSLISRSWAYIKQTYGSFGPDPRVYSIHHTNRFFGGHPGDRFSSLHDFLNSSDIGVGSWAPSGGNNDIATHELCHVIESASNNVHGSPSFPLWRDSKWAEICQYDLYLGLGMTADAQRVFTRFSNTVDNFPRAGTRWFRDFFFPVYRDHGGRQVMPRYFRLLAQHFPKTGANHGNGSHSDYTRDLNFGEFIHFMSGAAQTNLSALAQAAFGNTWVGQFNQARITFPGVTY